MGAFRWVALVLWTALGTLAGRPAAAQNPVAAENALGGDGGWRLTHRAAPGVLEAYAGVASVEHGEPVDLHARADAAHTATWKLYRMGGYGGAEARLVAQGGPVPVGPQPVPSPSAATGLVECAWPVTFTVATDRRWTSGVYPVRLQRDDGPQTFAIFVVRADERKGVAVAQASFTTYQAYNPYGGRSLYVAIAPDGTVFVSDTGNQRIVRLERHPAGWAVVTVAGAAGWTDRLVRRITLAGASSTSTVAGITGGGFSDGPAGEARFIAEAGIAVDGGAVLVADAGNARQRRVSGGVVTTLAGSGEVGGADGTAKAVRFGAPTAILALGDGQWLVVDQGASTLRVAGLAPGSVGPGGGAGPTGGSGAGGATVSPPRGSGCASAGDWATLLAPPLVLWLLRPRRGERERRARRAPPARPDATPRTFDTAWLEPGGEAAGSKASG